MKRFFILLTLICCLPLAARAEWALLPTEDLVRDSHLIVVGTLQSVSESSAGGMDYGEGVILVREVLWGAAQANQSLKLKWSNPSDLLCPRVEHRAHAEREAIWLLTKNADGSVAADYPGRFLLPEHRGEVESLLARGLFLDGGAFQPDEPFTVTVIFRNASKTEKKFPGLFFDGERLSMSLHSELTVSVYASDQSHTKQKLPSESNKLRFADELDEMTVPPGSEVKLEFDLKALYRLSNKRGDFYYVNLTLAGQPAANEASIFVKSYDESELQSETAPQSKSASEEASDFVFEAPSTEARFRRTATARASVVFLLTLLIFLRFNRR